MLSDRIVDELMQDPQVREFLKERVAEMCLARLRKDYETADRVRDYLRGKLGLVVRYEGKHVKCGSRERIYVWTSDAE
jgi:hypothetical protein